MIRHMDVQEKERVLMAMSGGVDSSVSAALLLEAGYDVEGVTMKLFDNDDVSPDEWADQTCCSLRDVQEARQVCLGLGIPHIVYNFTSTFEQAVMDKFCTEYLSGRTPNPCIDCNRHLKFAALQQRRRDLGFDYVATGHYAQRCYDEESGRYLLKRGLDTNKDQSYVLFHLDQDTLAHMLFPLGAYSKPAVREIARRHGFLNAEKAESQDICFVPGGDYPEFIARHTGKTFEPGEIVDCEGRVLGTHLGLIHYTVGQRKGIGVAAPKPLYVFAKDVERNRLVVGTDAETKCTGILVEDANFIALPCLNEPIHCTVKTHYRQTARDCTIEQTGETTLRITFDEPQRACAPGQFAVAYDNDSVICGGTIASSF